MDLRRWRLSVRRATDYQCLAGATKGGAVAVGSLKDSAIILDGPNPLAS
jgi:hypothetical protein